MAAPPPDHESALTADRPSVRRLHLYPHPREHALVSEPSAAPRQGPGELLHGGLPHHGLPLCRPPPLPRADPSGVSPLREGDRRGPALGRSGLRTRRGCSTLAASVNGGACSAARRSSPSEAPPQCSRADRRSGLAPPPSHRWR